MEATTAQFLSAFGAIVAALVALVSVIVGPLVACHVAQIQIKASVVSANRRVWIETLRSEVATFVAKITEFSMSGPAGTASSDRLVGSGIEVSRLMAKIRLLLNPTESDHSELVSRLRDAQAIAARKDHATRDLGAACDAIVVVAQKVLKREWERVKQEAIGETVAEMLKRVLKVAQ